MGVKVRDRKGTYRYLTVSLLIILFHISLVIPTIEEQLKDADAAYLRGKIDGRQDQQKFISDGQAGLRAIRFHNFRYSYASWLIGNGESLAYVKEQLGHSSIQITVDTYGHLIPGANRHAVNRLAGILGPPVDLTTKKGLPVPG